MLVSFSFFFNAITLVLFGGTNNGLIAEFLNISVPLNSEPETVETGKSNDDNVSIAIVGAGFAGIAAYKKLKELGFSNVRIFEASNRAGGRVYPTHYDGIYLQHGAEFINGDKNPIYEIAQRLGLIVGEVEDNHLIESDLVFVNRSTISDDILRNFRQNFSEGLEQKYMILAQNPDNWHLTVGELAKADYEKFILETNPNNQEKIFYDSLFWLYKSYYEGEWSAETFDNLSLQNYAKWSDRASEHSFSSYRLNHLGYMPILKQLLTNVDRISLFLNSRVTNIDYSVNGSITLTLDHGGELVTKGPFDYVIVTVPIGHLKRYSSKLFTPPLPCRKLTLINAIGFGAVQKLFLVYEKPFWTDATQSLVALHIENDFTKIYQNNSRLFRNLHTFQPHPWHKNVIVGWLSGEGPQWANAVSDEELTKQITLHFRATIPEANISTPIKIIRKKWLEDDLYCGSYTSLTPESLELTSKRRTTHYEVLSSPIYHKGVPKVLFAGEGTHNQMYQTVTGAYLSGIREAERLMNYVEKKHIVRSDKKIQC